ncbi:hypothetical protein D3C81_1843980 [compost metagenome]
MLAIAPESPVIRVVAKVMTFSESMRLSMRSGEMCKLRNGSICCRSTILRVSSLLYFGSRVENSLSDAASTPNSAVSTMSITITTMVMASGRRTPRRINQVTNGLRTMAKKSASNS